MSKYYSKIGMCQEVGNMVMNTTLVENIYMEDATVKEVMIEAEIHITMTKCSKRLKLIFDVSVEEIPVIGWIRRTLLSYVRSDTRGES